MLTIGDGLHPVYQRLKLRSGLKCWACLHGGLGHVDGADPPVLDRKERKGISLLTRLVNEGTWKVKPMLNPDIIGKNMSRDVVHFEIQLVKKKFSRQ